MSIRYEANINGAIEPGEPFTEFDELKELVAIFDNLNWNPEIIRRGRGGYYLFNLQINNTIIHTHIYLKRITFGGRAFRPYEKRAQFSAGLDRAGFIAKNEQLVLMLGIYKKDMVSPPVICAWDINDWGYNPGRAFNCFIDIRNIANSFTEGYVQSRTSIGQIVYSFMPEEFYRYLDEVKDIGIYTNNNSALKKSAPTSYDLFDNVDETEIIPKHTELFQEVIDVLKSEKYKEKGFACVQDFEIEIANALNLSENARKKIHNLKEGIRTELGYQLAWARTYLKLAGLIYSSQRSVWALTEKGWTIDKVDKFDIIEYATGKSAEEEFKTNENFNETSEGVEREKTDTTSTEIIHPFDPSRVDIRTKSMTLDLILKRLQYEEINLNTGFQRKAGLWDNNKKSRLIESILIRIPLPAFYFDGTNDNKWLVVDGLQRITALHKYVNESEFALSGLEFLTEYEGLKFKELPVFLQRRIEEFEITAYIIAAGTPPELKYNVFKRINTGGLILSDQEIRNALNQGTPVKFVKELSTMNSFKLATDYSISEDRMLDQEFVTRFLAFYLFDYEQEYTADLESYLNKAMSYLVQYKWEKEEKSNELIIIQKDFDKSMKTMLSIFGYHAFRKIYDRNSRRNPINKALFDSWSVTLSKLSEPELNKLIDKKDILINQFIELMNTSEDFNKAITSSTGDKSRIRRRFNEISGIVQSTLNLL